MIAIIPLNDVQRAALFATLQEVDLYARRDGREVDEELFDHMFRAELHRRMVDELCPIHRHMARISMLDTRPRWVMVNGVMEAVKRDPLPEMVALEEQREAVIARYMEGLPK